MEGASLNDSVLGAKDSLRSEDELGPDLTAGVRVVDVPDGGVKAGHIGGTKAILVRRGEEIFAIGATCIIWALHFTKVYWSIRAFAVPGIMHASA